MMNFSEFSHVEILSELAVVQQRSDEWGEQVSGKGESYDIHCIVYDGRHLVLDIQNSFLLAVDDEAKRSLEKTKVSGHDVITNKINEKSGNSLQGACHEINYLRECGLFPPATQDNPKVLIDNFSVGILPIIKMTLILSYHCNLSCRYCYLDQYGYTGTASPHMPWEVAKKAIDYLFDKSIGSNTIIIEYFGGEPFLNREVLYRSIEYSNQKAKQVNKRLETVIVTNGTLFDTDTAEFLNQFNTTLLVSIDGPVDIHDQYRRKKVGGGSLQEILLRISHITKVFRKSLVACPTFTSASLGNLDRIVDFLYDAGFRGIFGNTSRLPVGEPGHMSDDDYRDLVEEYLALAPKVYKRSPRLYFYLEGIYNHIRSLFYGAIFPQSCTSFNGTSTFVVVPEGRMYPCLALINCDRFFMGQIPDEDRCRQIRKIFYNNTASSNQHLSCRQCWARFLCGGKCPVFFLENRDFISSTACRTLNLGCNLERFRINKSMELAYNIYRDGSSSLRDFVNFSKREQ